MSHILMFNSNFWHSSTSVRDLTLVLRVYADESRGWGRNHFVTIFDKHIHYVCPGSVKLEPLTFSVSEGALGNTYYH